MPTADPWLRCWRPVRTPVANLVCLPHAGGSPGFFSSWVEALPDIQVFAAHYPGRGERAHEPPETSMPRVARRVAQAIRQTVDPGGRLILLGHSLGAPVALETARVLAALGTEVDWLIASGSRPGPHEPTERRAWLPEQSDAEVLAGLRDMGGTDPEALADPEFVSLVTPYVKADSVLYHSYVMELTPTLRCPITTIAGREDVHADVRPWPRLTTGRHTHVPVAGGHFYLVDRPPIDVVSEIAHRGDSPEGKSGEHSADHTRPSRGATPHRRTGGPVRA
ncbi:alpha/beta fold hydrolase [Micromonospora sp. NPDC049645]|uniref:thioesterase II family protein n=1 Tax=Micromonospora sp. NPDC049645 TaxID=3155508 RepID=UPI00343E2CFC